MSTIEEPLCFNETSLKAMRDATKLVFKHDQGADSLASRGTIVCVKEIDDGVWGTTERRIEVSVNSRVRVPREVPDYTTCNMTIRGYNPELKAALAFLKPTDSITIEWLENTNGHLEKAGLVLDMLYLIVRRQVRKELESFAFVLDTRVCENASYARFIKI